MTKRDFLWCALHMILDEEEAAALLCPACRAQAERDACPVCGGDTEGWQEGENAAFDMNRFLEMREGIHSD